MHKKQYRKEVRQTLMLQLTTLIEQTVATLGLESKSTKKAIKKAVEKLAKSIAKDADPKPLTVEKIDSIEKEAFATAPTPKRATKKAAKA